MNAPVNTNVTEAHYVALRLLVAILRDQRINAVASKHPEVTRAALWLSDAFGGMT